MFWAICNELFLLCALGLLALSIPVGRLLRKRSYNEKHHRRKPYARL